VKPGGAGGLLDSGSSEEQGVRPSKTGLTPREREVMKLLAEGIPYAKIAGCWA